MLAAERRGARTVVTRAAGHVPYAAKVVPARPGWARVVLVQTIAGPLAGDDVSVELEFGPGAAVEVVTNAATLAYPADTPARQRVVARLEAGARLAWLPAPLILAAGCNLDASVELFLEAGAAAVVRELVVLGRHDERPGRYRSRVRCELDGRPLLHDAVEIDPSGVAATSPAVLAGSRAFCSLALLGPASSEPAAEDELLLEGPGRVLRLLAASTASLQARLERAERAYVDSLSPCDPQPAP